MSCPPSCCNAYTEGCRRTHTRQIAACISGYIDLSSALTPVLQQAKFQRVFAAALSATLSLGASTGSAASRATVTSGQVSHVLLSLKLVAKSEPCTVLTFESLKSNQQLQRMASAGMGNSWVKDMQCEEQTNRRHVVRGASRRAKWSDATRLQHWSVPSLLSLLSFLRLCEPSLCFWPKQHVLVCNEHQAVAKLDATSQ